MRNYDYVIVGAGFFGAVFARELTDAGYTCLIIDRRPHIGGNSYTKDVEGVNVHVYGPHIFHCSSKKIWDYVNRFAEFNNFVNSPKINYKGNLYSFPINLMTLYQLYGVKTPSEAAQKLEEVRIPCDNPQNLEEWILSQVGPEIYETFIKGYTTKQWGRDPKELPASIIKRLPIRLTFNENYYKDRYQGIPIGGYTKIFEGLLNDIDVKVGVDFFKDREFYESISNKIIFTGNIDEFFDYRFGELEYRSLKFEHQILDGDYQGNAVINYTEPQLPYTRIVEHKHFQPQSASAIKKTIITHEYPQKWTRDKVAYYPVNDHKNMGIYKKYCKLAGSKSKYIFGGRLAEYKYYDMHQVIGSALKKAKDEIKNNEKS